MYVCLRNNIEIFGRPKESIWNNEEHMNIFFFTEELLVCFFFRKKSVQ